MKKLRLLSVLFIFIIILAGCNKKEILPPTLVDVQNICNLATTKCYYHNVAKSTVKAGEGLLHIGEKDRDFWIEYTGTVTLGIDMNYVSIKIDNNTVTVQLPKAKILNIGIDAKTLNEDSYIASEDGWNKNKITADRQNQAIANAQETMKATVLANQSLLDSAQNRAKTLIQNYINQMGDACGIKYTIIWEEVKTDVQE